MSHHDIEDDDAERIFMGGEDRLISLGISNSADIVLEKEIKLYARDILASIVPVPEKAPKVQLDAVSCAILAHQDINAEAVCALAYSAGGVGIRNKDEDRVVLIEVSPPNDAGHKKVRRSYVVFSTLIWYQDWTLEIPDILPEAVMMMAEGKLLKTIVSHPALDALELEIMHVDGRLIRIRRPKNSGG